MMVTFVSQCEKNALKKTRRVLDAFANRIGDNTWQTLITEDGLITVKRMLRQTASKSTAVSCHWIRSRARSQFLWVVGNKTKFNSEGIVAVNRTRKDLLNSEIENDWKYLPLIKSLTAMSALFHDWGKASKLFQEKLNPNSKNKFKGDPIRHEWISVLLLNTFIQEQDDKTWLNVLVNGEIAENKLKKGLGKSQQVALEKLPDAAKLVAWLIVSHHRLPNFSNDRKKTRNAWLDEQAPDLATMLKRITQEWGYENKQDEQEYQKRVKSCFEFPNGFLSQSSEWLKQVKRWSNSLLQCLPLIESAMQDGSYRLVLHHARLCLMLGDHFYSSQDAAKQWKDNTGLFANTDRETGEFKQKLDEHLVGVARNALSTAHLLPAFEQEPPVATDIQVLRSASPTAFKWQDKAVTKINDWQKTQDKKAVGFFAVNMASTGCGKTFANAKVMRALSIDGKSLRYILALGLRTLTLQTGDEYRDRIGLTKSQLAVLIGSKAVAELHNSTHIKVSEQNEITDEVLGSESQQTLLDEFIDFECEIPEEGLSTVLTCERDKQFLYAPVLACTIDHLMAATETKRGGRYILPSLRLMSSDLVIDEIDDFTGNDLIAIGRLIHLAGMLGRKVMISSATIPPDLAQGYFNAYKKGWQLFCNSRDEAKAEIGCAWIDEFSTNVVSINVNNSEKALLAYQNNHDVFIDKRVQKLAQQVAKRKAEIISCALSSELESNTPETEKTKQAQYFSTIQEAILTKHKQHHSTDKKTSINISFGVVRVANISPCVELTKYLLQAQYPENTQVKVMAYHSQQVLLLRHEQEKHLDAVLKRKEKPDEEQQALANPIIRNHLDTLSKNTRKIEHVIFILVATPVEEVGRDHDFDWAIVEPSSYRSIVQLAGRVRRHRNDGVDQANIGLMQYNIKAFKTNDKAGKAYFTKPGYEDSLDMPLPFHDLTKLINEAKISANLNAIPRIQKLPQSEKQFLAAVEHKVTAIDLTSFTNIGANTLQGYLTQTWYLTALPQVLTPFRQSEVSINLFLFYNENSDSCYFTQKDEAGKTLVDESNQAINREGILNICHVKLSESERKNLWLERNYQKLLPQYISEPWLISSKRVSLRYGEINFVERENTEFEYNDQFGLVKVNKKGGEKC
ncbi:type I-F CRISPR-associated helicase Cas3f [Colwellia ponticola]|uniref:Type I-F CRISPR-associated helicase Cas3 n=1 Tax=Colwellia ponticola TaxID=2304625 RepID=A0A8H2JSB8_9GAMM|nr:type I-F CRISPR-associated helicase Cas3f [Colwellia ponticola]TMM47633.1 type I-F CRISPR-associated helicase Cas3 [Colwellia ponticola]